MTELEAINILLSVIGEAPIESFATELTNEVSDSAIARRTLAEIQRDVLAEGWSWNTDDRVKLTKLGTGEWTAPANALHVQFDRSDYPDGRYVMRGNRVYDRILHTMKLPELEDLTASRVVYGLVWDEMPHAAQQYVVIRAARIYADRFINSNVIFTYTVQDEQYARAMLLRDEESKEQNNMLWGPGNHGYGYRPPQGMRFR